jgi:short-subunit dehydrogenase
MDYRTAFVTGASSGIGRELARKLAQKGVEVALAARREEPLREIERDIVAGGGKARVYALDVRDVEATRRALDQADQDMGGVDLVIANAGVNKHRWSGELEYRDCADILAVNVEGAVATLVALLPRMVQRRRGHLVGISSLAQYGGLPSAAAYSASKAFLSTFLESLRIDLESTNVMVTDVRPGFVRTPMTQDSKLPMRFILDVEPAAQAIVDAIVRKAPVVAFPWQLATLVRAAALLPPTVYDAAVRRLRGAPERA